MNLLCRVCDRSIIENESEYYIYLATLRKKDDKKYTINNINLDDVDKILNDYISTDNKSFDFYFLYCEFKLQFDKSFYTYLKASYVYNKEIEKISQYLFFYIECTESKGYEFHKNNQMIINIISDRCNKSTEMYIDNPMPMVERRINFIIAKNPQLIKSLHRNKNHALSRKYSHIPFNN